MKITYQLVVHIYDQQGLSPNGKIFLEAFSSYQHERTAIFLFEDYQVVLEAISCARMNGLDEKLFYIFSVSPEEISTHPGFYFSPDVEEEIIEQGEIKADYLKEVEVAMDFQTDQIVLNERAKQILEENTLGAQFIPLGEFANQNWSLLDTAVDLPDPIYVPRVMFLAPNDNPPGTYTVQSDGRDMLTDRNVAWLQKHGIAISQEVLASESRMKWRPRILVAGYLAFKMQRAEIRGIKNAFTPLIPEGSSEFPTSTLFNH